VGARDGCAVARDVNDNPDDYAKDRISSAVCRHPGDDVEVCGEFRPAIRGRQKRDRDAVARFRGPGAVEGIPTVAGLAGDMELCREGSLAGDEHGEVAMRSAPGVGRCRPRWADPQDGRCPASESAST
jgi:hypothetical protein